MYCIKTSNLKDKICGIYLLFFPESSKIYIGQSNNIRRRMYEHNNIKKNIKNKYIKDLMNEYNVSRGAISAVVNYKSFKNI